ncbi:MAG: antitoxin component YwqK of YwqJK toxin-antitoxin module [Parvicellaceae bacterium]|jgi:antitoxin component YwqK of YwqJK toxin-antitoxin module
MIRTIYTLSFLMVFCLSFGAFAQPMEYQGETVNQTIDGKKEGPWVIFAKMRNLKGYKPDDKYEEGNYKANRKAGLWKRYYPTGNLKSEITYANGRAAGTFTTYFDEAGKVQEQGNQKGRVLTGNFKRYHPNGQLAQDKNFNDKGQSEGSQKYITEDGVVELEFSTSSGVETGTSTRRYLNGDIKEIVEYGAGGVIEKRDQKPRVNPAKEEKKDDNAKETEVVGGTINDGGQERTVVKIPDGNRKVYNDNKDIWMDGAFKDGRLMDGKLYIYDEDGLIEKVEIYKNFKYAADGVIEF